jgi:hypothetical protein
MLTNSNCPTWLAAKSQIIEFRVANKRVSEFCFVKNAVSSPSKNAPSLPSFSPARDDES